MRIDWDGLTDFDLDLSKAISGGIDRAIAVANAKIVSLAAVAARAKASGMGGVAAKSAPAVSYKVELSRGVIQLDGETFPWALGAEFGSSRFKQFAPWTRGGYFLMPTLKEQRQTEHWEEALDDALSEAFPR